MGRRKKAVDWQAIRERHHNGESARAIAKDFDISHVAISDRAKREQWRNIPPSVKSTQTAQVWLEPANAAQRKQVRLGITSPENAAEILKLIERGSMPRTAAKMLGLTPKTWEAWLERDGELAGQVRAAAANTVNGLEQAIYGVGINGDARAAEQYLKAAERKAWSDGAAGGKAGIQVTINLDRSDPAPGVTLDMDSGNIEDA